MFTARTGHEPLQALRKWRGHEVIDELAVRGIYVRTKSMRGAAEEAPGAYKDVDAVAEAAGGTCAPRGLALAKGLRLGITWDGVEGG